MSYIDIFLTVNLSYIYLLLIGQLSENNYDWKTMKKLKNAGITYLYDMQNFLLVNSIEWTHIN